MRLTWMLAALLPLSALAGCLDQDVAPAATDLAAADELPPTPARTNVTIAEDGATPTGAAVCSPIAGCHGQWQASEASSFQQRLGGVLDAAELTLTWDAASPATETLMLGIAISEDGEWRFETEQGASPLTLSRAGLDIPADAEVWVYVNAHKCTPTPVAPCVSTSQPFHLEGVLGVLSATA